mmetsp:Transcript_3478/g.5201  ORF Transcript_3478/g.5201 Transcript_3478/m.5201 type:complete len:735 (-) Transcript_3478:6-2210(-)
MAMNFSRQLLMGGLAAVLISMLLSGIVSPQVYRQFYHRFLYSIDLNDNNSGLKSNSPVETVEIEIEKCDVVQPLLDETLHFALDIGGFSPSDIDEQNGTFVLLTNVIEQILLTRRNRGDRRIKQHDLEWREIVVETFSMLLFDHSISGVSQHKELVGNKNPAISLFSSFRGCIQRMEKLSALVNFLIVLVELRYSREKNMRTLEKRKEKNQDTEDAMSTTVLVAGGGPVGLLSALSAWEEGANVHVVEKRISYTRDIWFDLYPPPWYDSHLVLERLGFFTQDADRKDWKLPGNKNAYTVRAQTLEKFLAKVCLLLRIRIRFGVRFEGFCIEEEQRVEGNVRAILLKGTVELREEFKSAPKASKRTQDSKKYYILQGPICGPNLFIDSDGAHSQEASGVIHFLQFDLLVGADGSKSRVAKSSGISKTRLQNFSVPVQTSEGIKFQDITVPDLHQMSMVLDFKPKTDGGCPATRDDIRGTDPYHVGFIVDGLIAVFKRFYFGHCQMQFLFTYEAGKALVRKLAASDNLLEQAAELPWEMVLKVCNVVLQKPFLSKEEIKRALQTRKDGSLVAISIDVARTPVRMFKDTSSREISHALVVLVGDALSTAHYRLGVGINTGFRVANRVGTLVRKMMRKFVSNGGKTGPLMSALASQYEREIKAVLQPILQLQGSTMFYESYCGMLVFFDHEEDELVNAQVLYARGRDIGEYNEIDYSSAYDQQCLSRLRTLPIKSSTY